MIRRLSCKHDFKLLTNIYGDVRNSFDCCSIYNCVKCGKWQKSKELVPNFDIGNFKPRYGESIMRTLYGNK